MKFSPALVAAGLFTICGCSCSNNNDSPPDSKNTMAPRSFKEAKNNTWYNNNDSDTVFVFVHGIFSNSRDCWTNENASNPAQDKFWPQILLEDKRFNNPSIYLGSYYTDLNSGTFAVRDCSKQLLINLTNNDGIHSSTVMDKDNIIFICHSTGGVVVRQLLLDNSAKFKNKKIGLVLIASPSLGSDYANYFNYVASYTKNQLVTILAKNNPLLMELDRRFKDNNGDKKVFPNLIGTEAYENHFIHHSVWFPDVNKVVEEFSAVRYWDSGYQVPNTNHFTIVKPDSIDAESHKFLYNFYVHKFLANMRPSDENEVLYQGIEADLRRMADIFKSVRPTFKVSLPMGTGLSFQVDSTLSQEEWNAWDATLRSVNEKLAKINDPVTERQKAIKDVALGTLALREKRGKEAGDLFRSTSVQNFLEGLKQDTVLATSLYIIRAQGAEWEQHWALAIHDYKAALAFDQNNYDVSKQLLRCHVLYSHALTRKGEFGKAYDHFSAAQSIFLLNPQPVLSVLEFNGTPDAQGVPEPWVLIPFVGEVKTEVVREEGQGPALRLTTKNSSASVNRAVKFDLKQTPMITWEWRADELPVQGDLRVDALDDQACQLVLSFFHDNQFVLFNYVWDANAPVGTTYFRTVTKGILKYKMLYLVVRSGTKDKGIWVRETRNVVEDLKMVFSKESEAKIQPDTVVSIMAIAVQSNTQHTQTSSLAMFRTIRLMSSDFLTSEDKPSGSPPSQ